MLAPRWRSETSRGRLRLVAPDTAVEYARTLYAQLRRLDASGADGLIVAETPATPECDAIRARLNRASSGSAA